MPVTVTVVDPEDAERSGAATMSQEHDSEPYVDDVGQRLTVAEAKLYDDVVLVAVGGDLNIGTTGEFHRRLSEIVAEHPAERLELDLSALDFCDLAGLRAMLTLEQTGTTTARQARIVVAARCFDLLLDLCRTPAVLGYAPPPPLPHRDGG
ncbi:STAS domain-containing protein [Actinoplanes sp. NPDC020271]|uniref:STAS domain-containing protein n=1 Tax=Actinoplanes sp. NPDC020271 TaxID=3363896 RepID=UPI00378BA0ED